MTRGTTFSALPIGTVFTCGGTRYRKRSSRTADNLDYGNWFYFGAHERVKF